MRRAGNRLVFGEGDVHRADGADTAGSLHHVEWRAADAPYDGERQAVVVRDATALPAMPDQLAEL